jgi:apolipoprotein N-acyltransferase
MMHTTLNWLRHSNSFWGRTLLAIVGGLSIAVTFPAFNFVPGIFIGIFLILLAIRQAGFFKALALGTFAGIAYYGLVLKWLTTYLGPIPWVALSVAEGLIFGLAVAVIAFVWQWLAALNLGSIKPLVISFAIATIYTAREYAAGQFPFGGLPWARGGLSQADNYLAKWVWAVDISGLTWLIAFVCAIVAIQFVSPLPKGSGLVLRSRNWLPSVAVGLVVFVTPLAIVLDASPTSGKMKVAAVQGNANAGLFAVNPPGSIMDKHIAVARELISSGRAQGIDLMVWPENAADLDPVTMIGPKERISNFVDNELKAPLLFGNKTFRGADYFNEVDLWLPEKGLTDWYDKKRPVPFGEYVPNRSFFMSLAPEMIGLIGWDMSFGKRDGIFEIPQKGTVGSLICFEVTIDQLSYDLADSGAKAIMVQTNSSDFGKSEQGVQLAAVSRMRAIETGKTVVSISTVGVSGIYFPDGSIADELTPFTADAMVVDIPLRTQITPAVAYGRYIEPSAFAITLLLFPTAVIGNFILRRRRKKQA